MRHRGQRRSRGGCSTTCCRSGWRSSTPSIACAAAAFRTAPAEPAPAPPAHGPTGERHDLLLTRAARGDGGGARDARARRAVRLRSRAPPRRPPRARPPARAHACPRRPPEPVCRYSGWRRRRRAGRWHSRSAATSTSSRSSTTSPRTSTLMAKEDKGSASLKDKGSASRLPRGAVCSEEASC